MTDSVNILRPLYFNFLGSVIRVVTNEEKIYFVTSDFFDCFKLTNEVEEKLIGNLEEEEKKVVMLIDSLGRIESSVVTNEFGFYSLIFNLNSEKKESEEKIKKFRKWIFTNVLVKVRKSLINDKPVVEEDEKLILAKAFVIATKKLEETKKPTKASNSTDEITSTTIATELGTNAVNLHKWLIQKGVIYNVGGVRHLTSNYVDKGLATHRTYVKNEDGIETTFQNLVWTSKGRDFIRELYKEDFRT